MRLWIISSRKSQASSSSLQCLASAVMNKEAALSIAERDFILNALREDVRLDGRGVDQLRPLVVSFGEEYGHVNVRLGKTR
jgi:hypothetical protein